MPCNANAIVVHPHFDSVSLYACVLEGELDAALFVRELDRVREDVEEYLTESLGITESIRIANVDDALDRDLLLERCWL